MPDIKIFHLGPTRSQRAIWALDEAGLSYQAEGKDQSVFADPELRRIHPLAKLPAALFDGKPLFESAAICTYIADLVPEKSLIPPQGSFERAQHDQWCYFAVTELEAWLWSSAVNSFVLPEEKRLAVVHPQNRSLVRRAARVLNDHLADHEYLLGDGFQVTDIIVSYAVNWAIGQQWVDEMEHLHAYIRRLQQREHCPLKKG